jgi:hypothetical protein
VLVANILGNGPSLKFFKLKNISNNFIIGTNNIFYLNQFNLINNEKNFYTAYDERFFKKGVKDWLKQVKNFKGKVFFPPYWKNKKELDHIKNINFSLPKKNFNLVQNYMKLFSNSDDLKSSVIITSAIPLALSLKADLINLYGCEFRYKLNKYSKLTKDSYFYKNKNYGFEHSKKTEELWSKIQYNKLKKIKLFLSNHNVAL